MCQNITVEDADIIFEKQNHLCYFTKQNIFFGKRQNDETTASLDRIDSSRGYEKDNIQWVHKDVNMLKGRMKDSSLIRFCDKYYDTIRLIKENNSF